jgi:hypothetical protein
MIFGKIPQNWQNPQMFFFFSARFLGLPAGRGAGA